MGLTTIRLAVIGGDGIGPEVAAEALKVLRPRRLRGLLARPARPRRTALAHRTGERCTTRCWRRSGVTTDPARRGRRPTCAAALFERGLLLRLRFELDR